MPLIGVIYLIFIPGFSAVIAAEMGIRLRLRPTINRLKDTLQVFEQYGETRQLSNPLIDDASLGQLIAEFDPLSYDSKADFSRDKRALVTAFDCYERLGKVNQESEFAVEVAVQQLAPDFPTSISELRANFRQIERKTKAIVTLSRQTRQLESLLDSECRPIIAGISDLINQQLSDIDSPEGVEDFQTIVNQLKAICEVHQREATLTETRFVNVLAVEDLAKQAVVDPEANRPRVKVAQELPDIYEKLESLLDSECRPIIAGISDLINQRLADINNPEDVTNLKAIVDQLKKICDIYQRTATFTETRFINSLIFEDLAKQAVVDPEANRPRVNAAQELPNVFKKLEYLLDSECRPIIAGVSDLINQQLADITSPEDIKNLKATVDQLKAICEVHHWTATLTETRLVDVLAVEDLAKQAVVDPEANRPRVDAAQELLVAYEMVNDGEGARLSSSTTERIIDILVTNDPVSEPKETIETSQRTPDAISILTEIQDVDLQYLDKALDTLERDLLEELDSGSLNEERVAEYEELIKNVLTLADFVDKNANHPLIDTREWRQELIRAVEEGYPKRLNPYLKQRERMVENFWSQKDLYAFDWKEFEHLVGTLFEAEGYDVEVTKGGRDLGVDVWAEKDNQMIAIQVKQFSEGNTVGRETLQKLASTLAKGTADKVIVVTSSSFAGTAEDYAQDFGPEIELVDRKELIRRLIKAEVPAPPKPQRVNQ